MKKILYIICTFCLAQTLALASYTDLFIANIEYDWINKTEVEKLATGMVISRIFRGSIEKMFNTILYPDYLIKQLSGASLKPWDNIKFVQSNYNGNTRTAARDKFVSTFTTICVELNK